MWERESDSGVHNVMKLKEVLNVGSGVEDFIIPIRIREDSKFRGYAPVRDPEGFLTCYMYVEVFSTEIGVAMAVGLTHFRACSVRDNTSHNKKVSNVRGDVVKSCF
jgi:hypothetical protein